MAATSSTMVPIGTPAPAFTLPDVNGKTVSLEDFEGSKALLVMFICNHCPFVKLVRSELAKLGKQYQAKGVGVVAINANDTDNYPEDAFEKMRPEALDAGYTFPYLYDASQETAKAYHAACTPDFFLFDQNKRLVYRGQLDDARPGNGHPVTGSHLRAALDAILEERPVPGPHKPSMGCNIKWKPGNAPAYYGAQH